MTELTHQGLRLHYVIHGRGAPVVLLHGGGASFERNYAMFGWTRCLNSAHLQVIGLDFRGHGGSDKPHDSQAYGTVKLASDVLALLDHLQLQQVMLIGYSIGSAVALHLLHSHPGRVSKAVLLATGDGLLGLGCHTLARVMPQIAQALARTTYPKDLPRHLAAYWNFTQARDGDRLAVLALAQASYPPLTSDAAARIQVPVLVVSGESDPVLGRGPQLAALLGQGRYLEIKNADHFALAADPATQTAVANFLAANLDSKPSSGKP